MSEYKCVNGHGLCSTSYPSESCPYCEPVEQKVELSIDEHGSCKNCGFDLNGERIYDHFLDVYDGDEDMALEKAELYGAKKGFGRFGKAICVTIYDEDYKKLPKVHTCPECREMCY